MKIFKFDNKIRLEENSLMLVLRSLEVYKSVFNITEKNINFGAYEQLILKKDYILEKRNGITGIIYKKNNI